MEGGGAGFGLLKRCIPKAEFRRGFFPGTNQTGRVHFVPK
jgi:hypothetical protein